MHAGEEKTATFENCLKKLGKHLYLPLYLEFIH